MSNYTVCMRLLHLVLASNSSIWNSTTVQQTVSDQEMIAILSSMAESSAPAILPIKSPKRPRDLDSPDTMIPDSQPARKKLKTDQTEGVKTIRNRFLTLETRRAKCKWSLQVQGEHAKNSTCPYGLQYRPRPHIQFRQRIPDCPGPDQSPSPRGTSSADD